MIIDTLNNLEKYATLSPLFPQVIEYLKSVNLYELALGKIQLQGNDIVVNVNEVPAKSKEEAKLETHKAFIDIQIPLSNVEMMGYTPDVVLPFSEYNAEKDIAFYPGLSESYFTVKPGMFTIFFPQDGHAPGITPVGLKKIIVKVRV